MLNNSSLTEQKIAEIVKNISKYTDSQIAKTLPAVMSMTEHKSRCDATLKEITFHAGVFERVSNLVETLEIEGNYASNIAILSSYFFRCW